MSKLLFITLVALAIPAFIWALGTGIEKEIRRQDIVAQYNCDTLGGGYCSGGYERSK